MGRGTSFFEKAFGADLNEYHLLLDMPESMIIYRLFFEWLGSDEAQSVSRAEIGMECYAWSS